MMTARLLPYESGQRRRDIPLECIHRLANAGIVPVVVLDDAKDAVPNAKDLLAGGFAGQLLQK